MKVFVVVQNEYSVEVVKKVSKNKEGVLEWLALNDLSFDDFVWEEEENCYGFDGIGIFYWEEEEIEKKLEKLEKMFY